MFTCLAHLSGAHGVPFRVGQVVGADHVDVLVRDGAQVQAAQFFREPAVTHVLFGGRPEVAALQD